MIAAAYCFVMHSANQYTDDAAKAAFLLFQDF